MMMATGKVDFDTHSPDGTNDSGFSARQSFPPDGLVAMSRIAYQNTPLVMEKLRQGVFVFRGAGGNVTAVAGSAGCAVIDTGYGPRVDEIKSGVTGALSEPPKWLVNTHWHFDHTDGDSKFAEDGASVVAHKNCLARLSQDQYVASLEWKIPASPRTEWPTVTFDGAVAIDLGWETLNLIPQEPAHTDGDVAVWLPSANVLIMGDLMTNGSYPVIDESSRGSLRGMIDAIERLLRIVNTDTVVVPGHGLLGNRDTLLAFCDMLRTVEGRIQSMTASRSPVAAIIAAAPTRDLDAVWGGGYVTGDIFVRMVLAGMNGANTEWRRV
jgi:glyoxylase-like metal-dependent hydrolase (beta-lactamase superfamily II)